MNTVQYINEQQAKLDRIEKELLAAEKVLRILSSARNKLSELPQEEQKYALKWVSPSIGAPENPKSDAILSS